MYELINKFRTIWNMFNRARHKKYYIFEIFFHIIPVSKKTIFFMSFNDLYNDNPKYISEMLHIMDKNLRLVWVVDERTRIDEIPSYILQVKRFSVKHAFYKNRSKIIIDNFTGIYSGNTKMGVTLVNMMKKKGQFNYSTWHGTPMKKIGKSNKLEENKYDFQEYQTTSSGMLVNSEFMKWIFQHDFSSNFKVRLLGSPRNDILFKSDEKLKGLLLKKLGLPTDKKLVIYAPTYREPKDEHIKFRSVYICQEDITHIIKAMEDKFGDEWAFVYRTHQYVKDKGNVSNRNIYNGNLYMDMAEYLYVSDALITDYSGSLFDYTITNRPCFLYMPDYKEYEAERGVYFQPHELPYSYALSIDQLLNNIRIYEREEALKKVFDFNKRIKFIDDGRASIRISQFILDQIKG